MVSVFVNVPPYVLNAAILLFFYLRFCKYTAYHIDPHIVQTLGIRRMVGTNTALVKWGMPDRDQVLNPWLKFGSMLKAY